MSDYKQMTLGQCAEYDKTNKLREKLTGWAKISNARRANGISRKARIRAKHGKRTTE